MESELQARESADEALARGILFLRSNKDKPRTSPKKLADGKIVPDFEGVGEEGIPWILEATFRGITPALEVMLPSHVDMIKEGVLAKNGEAKVILWLGSRNQNHIIQREIGKAIDNHPNIFFMIKNQMWKDSDHWRGIVRHILSGGSTENINRISLCYRGDSPKNAKYRNPPNLDYALITRYEVEKEFGIPIRLIGDPSHAAGYTTENVIKMAYRMLRHRTILPDGSEGKFDGLMIETHKDPPNAKTDNGQQLNWQQLDRIIRYLNKNYPTL